MRAMAVARPDICEIKVNRNGEGQPRRNAFLCYDGLKESARLLFLLNIGDFYMDTKINPLEIERVKQKSSFTIDGYNISATFAEKRNPAVSGQIKQILLSSFTSNTSITHKVDMARRV